MPTMHLGSLEISTPAFGGDGAIPTRFTVDGKGSSPQLAWANIPEGTAQLVLICHDPDAPLTWGFTHWVVYGISPELGGLPEDGGAEFTEGRNELGDIGWTPPAPPPGHGPHHYFFDLYALDAPLRAEAGLTRRQVLDRIDDLIIEQARVIGTYERPAEDDA